MDITVYENQDPAFNRIAELLTIRLAEKLLPVDTEVIIAESDTLYSRDDFADDEDTADDVWSLPMFVSVWNPDHHIDAAAYCDAHSDTPEAQVDFLMGQLADHGLS